MMIMNNICYLISSRPPPFGVSTCQPAASLKLKLKLQQRRRPMAVCSRLSTDERYCTINGDKNGIDFYKLLSLSGSESTAAGDIKRAYRSMALRYHPDMCEPSRKEESTRMFVLLHMAYKTLSDPVLRAEYDNRFISSSRRSCSSSGQYWQEQVEELKKKRRRSWSSNQSSWGSRMRARNMINMHKH